MIMARPLMHSRPYSRPRAGRHSLWRRLLRGVDVEAVSGEGAGPMAARQVTPADSHARGRGGRCRVTREALRTTRETGKGGKRGRSSSSVACACVQPGYHNIPMVIMAL
jgi:hypothetical protein